MGANSKKVRVLIVDDSLVFRETLKRELSKDAAIEVIGTATDPFKARDLILSLDPDVITLDVEMPKMNGIEFLLKLMPQYPIPVVVISSDHNNTLEALKAGAVDFVSKPDVDNPESLKNFYSDIILKIKISSVARVKKSTASNSAPKVVKRLSAKSNIIIAIGASTGGTEATLQILKNLPKEMPPILLVQHMPPVFTQVYAQRLNGLCNMSVKEARDQDPVLPGNILVAPGDYHMQLVRGAKGYKVSCFQGEKVNGHCPSVDVLFESVANLAMHNAIGVILTGMGNDGAQGLLKMKNNGAYTFGQDEMSSVVYGMPKAAKNIGAVIQQLPISKIADHIIKQVELMSKTDR